KKMILASKISLGWCYLKLKRFELAQKAFEEAEAMAHDENFLSDDIYFGLATLYTEMKENAKALEAYNYLMNTFPNSIRILESMFGRANIFYLNKDYANAINEYQQIVLRYQDDPSRTEAIEKAKFGLAWTYLKLGDIQKSVQTFQDIMQQTKSHTVKVGALTQLGDVYQDSNSLDKAIEIYDRVLKEYSNSIYADYAQFRQGIALLKQDKVDSAAISFQSLAANFPKSKYLNDAQYYLAVSYFKKGDWAAAKDYAESYLQASLETADFSAEAYYVLANSMFNLNNPQGALKIFRKLIQDYPEQPAIVRNSELASAKCLYASGQVKEALKKFNTIPIQYPNSETAQAALFWLGDYYLENSVYENAIDYYQQIINIFPGSEKINLAFFQLGQAYEAQLEYDKALYSYSMINNPKDKEVYTKAKLAIAEIFSKKFDYNTAFETYQNIITHVPDYRRDAYVKMAGVYKERQSFTEAVEAYKKAMAADIGLSKYSNAELQFYIGDTHELLNQKPSAVEEYLKIPYLYPQAIPWIVKAYLRIGRLFEEEERWEEAKTIYQKVIDYKTEEKKFAQERLEWINGNFE
ncbi:MAG: tetratricopeptide repeat protein, partial [Candidatus Omnitrophota bacterium]